MEREHKITKRLAFVLTIVLLNACAYFENDGFKSEQIIVGNIGLIEYRGTEQVDLVFERPNNIKIVVIGDCRSVYYDSIKNIIFAKNPITDSTSEYYRIILKDPFSDESLKAFKIQTIDKDTFNKGARKKSSVKINLR